jgi:hypothetical protein
MAEFVKRRLAGEGGLLLFIEVGHGESSVASSISRPLADVLD